MGTEKRERQKANKAARLAAEEKAEARRRQIRLVRNAVILLIVIVIAGFVFAGCGSESSEGSGASTNSGEADPTASNPPGTVAPDQSNPGSSPDATYDSGSCPPADGVDDPRIDFDTGFAQCIDPAKTYTATVATTEGTVTIELDTERTPVTTNNFVALARYGYYDDTDLFRTEAQTGIIQGGAPHTQDNADPGPGPDFSVPDEAIPFTADDYGPGTLAMARTAAPNSASGQFFLLANEGGRYLGDPAQVGPGAGSYVAFGTVTEGLDVVEKIAALDDGTSRPSEPVSIETVTISET